MLRLLDIEAELALFDGQVQGLVVPFYENERPLRGLAGRLDWRFAGLLSEAVRSGALSGRLGECAYLPAQRAGRTYHLILVGGGQLSRYARRGLIPDGALEVLAKNLKTLQLPGLAISRADFGGVPDDYLKQRLGGAKLWIAP